MSEACEMKGFLSFLILWLLSKQALNGAGIALELEKRKGSKPSPGTLYPALKNLQRKGLIEADKGKVYNLTKKGCKELNENIRIFMQIFPDYPEMRSYCEEKQT